MDNEKDLKAREGRVRKKLAKQGYSLHKSRARLSIDNQGGYMISYDYNNTIAAGEHFDYSLEDVERFAEAE